MASMLLRAFRGSGRTASSAASAASRRAVVAASASGCPAASDRLLRRLPIVPRPFGRNLSLDHDDFPVVAPPPVTNHPGKVKFVADAKDLESDEALWTLYHRWCKAFGEYRDLDEMRLRFNKFKDFVLFVNRANKEAIRDGRSARFKINKFADGKLRELLSPKVPFSHYLQRVPANRRIFMRVSKDSEEPSLYPFA